MATLLLFLIYAAFISLGLPDALLGAAWPVMQAELAAPYSYAGLVQMLISGGGERRQSGRNLPADGDQ